MRMIKRATAIFWNRVCYPLYCVTIKAVRDKHRVREKYSIQRGRLNVVIFGSPNHGNLGDYAILEAEKKLLTELLPKANLFDVNMTDFAHEIKALRSLLTKKDLLFLTGGGNLGNQYPDDEEIRRRVIQCFPYNKILLFPQTMYFTKDEAGKKEREKTAAVYNNHKKLWLAARDEYSYEEMQKLFQGKVALLPDVVLTSGYLRQYERKGALLLLRSDVESVLTAAQKEELLTILKSRYVTAEETDTVISIGRDLSRLSHALKVKIEQIAKAELVITDRLHGMIFAAITGTPCMVLSNYNHKVRETYKWLCELDYIELLQDMQEIKESIDRLGQKTNCTYNAEKFRQQQNDFLKEFING